MQLLLFPEPIDVKFEREKNLLEEKHKKLCKSLHAKIGELTKKNRDLEFRLEILESGLCKERLFL